MHRCVVRVRALTRRLWRVHTVLHTANACSLTTTGYRLQCSVYCVGIVSGRDGRRFDPDYRYLPIGVIYHGGQMTAPLSHFRPIIQGGPKKRYLWFNFAITSVIVHRFSKFFTARTRNLWCIKVTLRLPPHLCSEITLPSKTHTAAIYM